MKEEWKDVPNYEGLYQVSNLGRVKSLKYNKEKVLKAFYNSKKYLFVTLNNKNIPIHQLVAMTFLNHKPNGHKIVVDHIDNDKSNNRIDNIQIITHRENSSKDFKNKTSKYTGVCWHKNRNKWITHIQINSNPIYLGSFKEEKKASQMYQLALKNIHLYNGDNKKFRSFVASLMTPQP